MLKFWKIMIPILVLILGFFLWKVTRQKIDPDWVAIQTINLDTVFSLEKSGDSLQILLEDFQGQKFKNKGLAIDLIDDPYVPIMEYKQFKSFIKILQADKRMIISTVEGGGTTTFIDRLSKFVAMDPNRILSLRCAPKFDLAYHRDYIGEYKNDRFIKGKLLKFWDRCNQNPDKKYIAIIDDFDKINPETLFGADLWENLGNGNNVTIINGEEVKFPDNFYMISTTQSAVGDRIHLHNEHFKRLGLDKYLPPSTITFALYLDGKRKKINKKIAKKGFDALNDKDKAAIKALNDTTDIKNFLYIFKKINQFIEKDISRNSQLGQWSNLRKLYQPKDREKFIDVFIHQVNALSPDKKFDRSSFKPIFYSIKNKGLLLGSSPLATGFKVFKEWGFLTEFVVGLSFALITAFISLYLTFKRKRKINKYLTRSEEIFMAFEQRETNTATAIEQLNILKLEIERNTKANNISFPEAIFFHNSIRSKVNAVEITKSINSTFLTLMDVFMDDGKLSRSEYDKLITFLLKIEYSIPKDDFKKMKEKVEKAWLEFGENKN